MPRFMEVSNTGKPCGPVSEGEARSDAYGLYKGTKTLESSDIIKQLHGPLFPNWPRLACDPIPLETIEGGDWYYLVFKPYNDTYDPEYKGLDFCRKFISKQQVSCFVITREVIASKIHYNVLLHSHDDFLKYQDHPTQKFMIYSDIVKPTIDDRKKVYEYITKEYYVNRLPWTRYSDYNYLLPKAL